MHPLKVKGVVFEGILNFINNSIYLFNLRKEGGEKKEVLLLDWSQGVFSLSLSVPA